MVGKVAARKAALREKLVDLAQAQIAQEGLVGLRARRLAEEAGCAVGAIYTHFEDLDALVLEVNGRTFARLGQAVAAAVAPLEAEPPNARLIAMAHAYLGFAAAEQNLWRALFDVDVEADSVVPRWYVAAMNDLFGHISDPLSELFPDKSAEDLDLLTRALFSSVHGIVLLGLGRRISAVPVPLMAEMIAQVLSEIGASRKN